MSTLSSQLSTKALVGITLLLLTNAAAAIELDLTDAYRWDEVDNETLRNPLFGEAVATNGRWAVVGAPSENNFAGTTSLPDLTGAVQ